jgi:DNA-binding NarL/FixJ family response regulator
VAALPRVPTPLPTYGETSIGELLELVLATSGSRLDRQVLAATLRALAVWLSEQSRLLGDADSADGALPLGLLPDYRHSTQVRLTARELQVAACIARGLSNRQIAADLVIAPSTTERHVANILNKLSMRSRAEIAAWATRHGLV